MYNDLKEFKRNKAEAYERWLDQLPVCDNCKSKIQDEQYHLFMLSNFTKPIVLCTKCFVKADFMIENEYL
jgi:hypothetical protein